MQLTLADAFRALRERWWVLLAAAVIAAATAYAYTRLPGVEPRWRSSVWLQAEGRFDYGSSLALEKQLRPLAERVRQLSVMREVDQLLHLDLPAEQMLAHTRAEPVLDSLQLRIDVEDPHGLRAEQIALAMADVYSQQHNARQEAALREERVILTVLDRQSTATLVWPQTRLIVPAAALLGLLASAAIVLLLAALDDTLRDPAEVQNLLGLPLVGVIPGQHNQRHWLARNGRAAAPGSYTWPAGSLPAAPSRAAAPDDAPRR